MMHTSVFNFHPTEQSIGWQDRKTGSKNPGLQVFEKPKNLKTPNKFCFLFVEQFSTDHI